ncbi:MAG: 16S rRNA (guanine(527)-N(7))-methyltransferase RsmG [Bacteroidota bacterium]
MQPILKYFPEISEQQKQQFGMLDELYKLWNARINVISRKDIDNLFTHHVLHSLAIAKVVSFNNGTTVMDVGTGGGFPGIPLAIMFPDVQFTLVDSVGKKIKVTEEIAKEAGLKNVKAVKLRAEEMTGRFDFVVSRAVTALPEIYAIIKNMFAKTDKNSIPNGLLYLKGGDLTDELALMVAETQVYDISSYFDEEYFLTKKVVHAWKIRQR